MYKIVCTDEKEKADWLEASEMISKLNLNQNQSVIKFLSKLFKEPGSIELSEKMVLPDDSRKRTYREGNAVRQFRNEWRRIKAD